MKVNSLLTTAVLILVFSQGGGCSTAVVSHTFPDGRKITAWNSRFLWKTEAFSLKLHSPDGLDISCDLQNTRTDPEAVGSVTEGAVKGIKSFP